MVVFTCTGKDKFGFKVGRDCLDVPSLIGNGCLMPPDLYGKYLFSVYLVMRLYLRDLVTALLAWVYLPTDFKKIERRWRFIAECVSEERQKQLPYRIIKAAYMHKLFKMLKRKIYSLPPGRAEQILKEMQDEPNH